MPRGRTWGQGWWQGLSRHLQKEPSHWGQKRSHLIHCTWQKIIKNTIIRCLVYKCGRQQVWSSPLGAFWHTPVWQPLINNHAVCKGLWRGGCQVKPLQQTKLFAVCWLRQRALSGWETTRGATRDMGGSSTAQKLSTEPSGVPAGCHRGPKHASLAHSSFPTNLCWRPLCYSEVRDVWNAAPLNHSARFRKEKEKCFALVLKHVLAWALLIFPGALLPVCNVSLKPNWQWWGKNMRGATQRGHCFEQPWLVQEWCPSQQRGWSWDRCHLAIPPRWQKSLYRAFCSRYIFNPVTLAGADWWQQTFRDATTAGAPAPAVR